VINNTSNTFLMVNGIAGNSIKIDFLELKKSSLTIRALNNNLRQQILKLLEVQSKLTVTEIIVQLRLEQSVVSQHLGILRQAGIVKTERKGKSIYYALHHRRIVEIGKYVLELVSEF
jgi:DNA-binding transcriptional ArsR family regulator